MASAVLHGGPDFNAEEAAHAAAEFVSSGFPCFSLRHLIYVNLGLDNLPGEVNFLLAEIKEKNNRMSRSYILTIY